MSFEIEIKAHVYNRSFVIEKLNSIAEYLGHTEKKDLYYHFPKEDAEKKYVPVRIRNQIERSGENKTEKKECYFTYKKKELKTCTDNSKIEVNVENETLVENADALEQFFMDVGGKLAYTKEKIVEHWIYKSDGEELHVELCTVPPLGDFLEIEAIKENENEAEITKIKSLEQQLLTECNIPLSQIENKYYSEMLASLN